MDPQSQPFTPFSNVNETWRLQTDVARMQQMQAEHAERIARLERRQDDDARMKSVWGPSSPFPSVLGGNTPQQAPLHQPPADQFRTFDDDANNMISSLHLDADEEPRSRGLGATSRANSVRFDETANTNHFSHSSRASGDFMPRTSSALGGLQLGERAMSHKSDGRASSQHSLRSAASGRANSLGADSMYGIADSTRSPLDTPGMAPGLLLLGAAPAIIRCWMNTNFKHDALLYAAICSGSYKSFLDFRLIQKLGFESEIRDNDNGVRTVELPVFFPEAIPLTSSSRSSSPAPHLPSLIVDFRVFESAETSTEGKAIQIFIGSDVLRAHNADILFSSNNMTLYDDERNKLSIPLARPEDEFAFNSLFTSSGVPQPASQAAKDVPVSTKTQPYLNGLGQDGSARTQAAYTNTPGIKSKLPGTSGNLEQSLEAPKSVVGTSVPSEYDSLRPASRQSVASRQSFGTLNSTRAETPSQNATAGAETSSTSQPRPLSVSRTSSTPAIWNNWRREGATSASNPPAPTSSTLDWGAVASKTRDSNALPPRRDASSGIKVLKPKASAARAFSTTATATVGSSSAAASSAGVLSGAPSPAIEGKSSRFFEEGRRRSGGPNDDAKSVASDGRKETSTSIGGSAAGVPKKSNPVGGASAFSWLNSAGAPASK